MASKNIHIIIERINNNKLNAGRKRYEALPQLFFLFGICVGFVLNLMANIIFESIKANRGVQAIVLLLALILLLAYWYWIHKIYIKPINELERKINSDFEELKKLLIK
jgi:hypothetical protein